MTLHVNLGKDSYDILVERGVLARAGEELRLDRKVLIVTDEGVPAAYAASVAAHCREAFVMTVKQGEGSKSEETLFTLLGKMLEENFTRKDCVVAVGGGVVGDLAGFSAACYMRGVDFYNIPTTLLSQVDSSIGGKTAINFRGIKNIIGAFYQPKKVLIDPDVLNTLPERQISAGFAESVKMAATADAELFAFLETHELKDHLEEIITRSIDIKRRVVEQDEKEAGLRKMLNFGHTLGHGIEAEQKGSLYHGECVALGMLPMCSASVRSRLLPILTRAGLPTSFGGDITLAMEAVAHDKKSTGDTITVIKVNEIGSFVSDQMNLNELQVLLETLQ